MNPEAGSLDTLAVEALLDMQHYYRVRLADVDRAVALRLLRPQVPAVSPGAEMTVEQVAERIHRPVSYVRHLLRAGLLKGFRRGRYWVIREADLLREGVDSSFNRTLSVTHESKPDPRAPETTRSYAIEVRKATRGPRGDNLQVGEGAHVPQGARG